MATAAELPYADRTTAGAALGRAVRRRLGAGPAVVLGLPRGGVPVAAPVAAALGAPLDVFVVRKLGTPGSPELAMGAIASGGVQVLNRSVVDAYGVPAEALERVAAAEQVELRRRERLYRGRRAAAEVAGATVVLVDDGLATGASVLAAVHALRALGPQRVVVAAPVGSPQACARVAQAADELVCLHAPARFGAVGAYYRDFRQTTDEQVQQALR